MLEVVNNKNNKYEVCDQQIHQLNLMHCKKPRKLSLKQVIAIFSIVIGLIGMWVNWREQINLSEIGQIKQNISQIQARQQHLNTAMTKATVTVINQIESCPTNNMAVLRRMKIERNNTLINLRTYSSGFNVAIDNQVPKLLIAFIRKIYFMKTKSICKINLKQFDMDSYAEYKKINDVFTNYIFTQRRLIKKIRSNLF